MTNQDSDGLFESDWDERRELTWTEADWEKYLAEHETAVGDYLRHYEQLPVRPDRIDEVARRMGWDTTPEDPTEELDELAEAEPAAESDFDEEFDLYTVHRNPVHIATKAIYVGLIANWERIAVHPERVHPAVGIALAGSLYRGREHALQAVQSLDMGDYALAVCFFKRALQELNASLARLNSTNGDDALLSRYREFALPRLFDLREIWLRVMAECRSTEQNG